MRDVEGVQWEEKLSRFLELRKMVNSVETVPRPMWATSTYESGRPSTRRDAFSGQHLAHSHPPFLLPFHRNRMYDLRLSSLPPGYTQHSATYDRNT